MELASSRANSWLASCLSCLRPPGEERAHDTQVQTFRPERDMKICHDQPNLVPPMRLVLYDDLPSPGNQSRPSTIYSWVAEGRNLAAKASNRASLTIRNKPLKPTRRPNISISTPSDFRRVDPPPPSPRVGPFLPLELSIFLPGNRLSDLPEFDKFDLDDRPWPKPPPEAFSPIEKRYSIQPDSKPFKVPRKPVGSISYRSSSATWGIEVHDRRRTLPNYSIPNEQESNITDDLLHARSKSEPFHTIFNKTALPTRDHKASKSLPSLIVEEPQPPQPPYATTSVPSSPRSTSLPPQETPPQSPPTTPHTSSNSPSKFSVSDSFPSPHVRSRTLSGSTISSTSTSTLGATRRSQSFSSALTGTTASKPSFDASPISKLAASRLEEPCPTVYEGKQHLFKNEPTYHETVRVDDAGLVF